MRKFYMLFVALFVSAFVSLASAQNYPVNVGTDATNTYVPTGDHPQRNITGVTLQGELGTKQTINVPEGKKVYNDMTSLSGGTFRIKAGQSAMPRFEGLMDWMHSYIFVDYGKDGQFNVTSLDYASDDLVSYFHFGAGKPQYNSLQNFSVPTTPGTYRMRYLIYWNNSADQRIATPDPAGTSSMGGSGDIVVDVNLEVEALVASILDVDGNALSGATYENAPAYGQDFTFSVPQKYKYSAAVTAKCGVDFSVAQTSETYTWYTYTTLTSNTGSTSSFTAKNWQEVTGIVANADGTFTIPGSQVKGDLQIQVTYTRNPSFTADQAAQGACYFLVKNRNYNTRYLKVGITPNSGATDRFTYEMPYLFTHTLTENRSDKDIASYIWRLTAAPTSGKYYMKGQGLALGSIPNGANKCVPLQATGAEITVAKNTSGYYTFTTGAGTQGYIHATNWGESRQDGNFTATTEGDFVVAWTASENPSQWTIEPIEDFHVIIGKGGWSSFNYAFPVAFNADEVSNVYISTSENTGVVTLAPIAAVDGMISVPSNTPIFVEGTEGKTCTVDLLTIEPTAVSGNTLRGTTLPQTATLNENQTAYVIATKDDKTALYKLGAGVKIPCNKAYYVSSQAQTAKLELNFGEVTEISNAVTAQPALKDEILYDLSGHRVVYPTRGIYVTGSGRKIFVK